jgi:nicotinate-nucleotide adenylyltransferase
LQREDQKLFFIAGADILPELPRWYAVDEILRLATLVVVSRPGNPPPRPNDERIRSITIPGVDVSSTELRRRVRAGEPIAYLTPPAVERLIRQRGLYV